MVFNDHEELKGKLRQIAMDFISKGPGYAQEGVVLRKAKSDLEPRELAQEQMILEAWQRLFIDGELAWGYDLDNPGPPFFHWVTKQPAKLVGAK